MSRGCVVWAKLFRYMPDVVLARCKASLERHRLHTQCRPRRAEAPIEGAERRAMIGADGQMQRVGGTQAQRILIRNRAAVRNCNPVTGRESRRELGCDP